MELNIDTLLGILYDQKGSDLYCVVGSPPMIKVLGQGIYLSEEPLKPADTEQLVNSFLTDEQQKMLEKDPEVNLAYSIPQIGRFRGNIYRQRGSIAFVFRRVESKIPTVEEMNLPPVLNSLILEPRGLILVTGATGSGKSTSLAAMIHNRNLNMTGHIVTIEDPIEFVHKNVKSIISQREVGTDTLSFGHALRSALRQAPDVILIGEMRDPETVTAALDFAETGHLVVSTLHSTNANQTIERIMQFFPQEDHPRIFQSLANNLLGIISQRLLRKADGSGRIPAVEIMINTPRITELLRKGDMSPLRATIAAGTQENMQTFDQHLYKLYMEKQITLEDALAAAESPNDLKLKIRGMSSTRF
jgi:twitching motility protein PilU